MNAICIKPTTRLVKNQVYKIATFNNNNTRGYSFFRPTIRIYLNDNEIHTFSLANFKPAGGGDFAQIVWMCSDYRSMLDEKDQMKIDRNLKSGDYVIPTNDGLKTLVKGRKYKVEDVRVIDHKSSLGAVSWSDIKIKLEGSSRSYTSYNFRKCTNQEIREINLKSLFDESTDTERVNKHKRKFDYFSDEEKKSILVKFLITSCNDRYRNKIDIMDWTIQKTAKNYSLTREDFDLVKDLSLMDVIGMIE